MMLFVIGGSGSGKSVYAEQEVCSLSKGTCSKKYYLAAMKATDDESRKKIARHRNLRKGKGFFTIEQPVNISCVQNQIQEKESIALLECISNLTANEMFSGNLFSSGEWVVEKIINEIEILRNELRHFVVVSSNVFEDGRMYDKTTMEYIQTMGKINRELTKMADKAVEVVVGIPVVLRQK